MRLRYRAQALADIDAIDRSSESTARPARSVLNAIYASIHLIAEHLLDPASRAHQVCTIGQSHRVWKL
jgi:hypothetical protein